MDLKKLIKAILFPHIFIMIILVPIAVVFLVYSMLLLGTETIVSIFSYVLAAYTLMIWCFRMPAIVKSFKNFKEKNKYIKIWQSETRLRVKLFLYVSLIYNIAYALLQLGMGLWHHTFWFCSLAGYYFSLAVMRFFLLRHTSKYRPGEKILEELKNIVFAGSFFLL